MKLLLSCFVIFLSFGNLKAQVNTYTLENPMTKKSYNLKVIEDFNLLITGDKNPKNGLAYSYNKSSEEISLSGKLLDFKNFGFLTLEGTFNSDEGSVIFNKNDKGAKKFEIDLNYFFTVRTGNYSKFGNINDQAFKSNRTLLELAVNHRSTNNKEKLLDSLAAYLRFAQIFKITSSANEIVLGTETRVNTQEDIIEYKKNRIVSESLMKSLLKRYIPEKKCLQKLSNAELESLKIIEDNFKVENGTCELKILEKEQFISRNNDTIHLGYLIEGLKLQEFLKDLKKLERRYSNYDKILYESEKKLAADLWTAQSLVFFGIHGSFKRESLDLFEPRTEFTSFNEDLFNTERGNLLEIGLSANLFKTFKKNSFFFFSKGFGSLAKTSNFSIFSKNTYSYTENIDINETENNDILKEYSKTGYTNKNNDAYSDNGLGFIGGLEVYGGHKNIGLFSRIEFKDSKIEDGNYTKLMPFRAGVFANFNSNEKSLVSVLIFAERTNLFLHPSEDFNIGFKIGLPLNLKKVI